MVALLDEEARPCAILWRPAFPAGAALEEAEVLRLLILGLFGHCRDNVFLCRARKKPDGSQRRLAPVARDLEEVLCDLERACARSLSQTT